HVSILHASVLVRRKYNTRFAVVVGNNVAQQRANSLRVRRSGA
ncbi:MAG: hypothetical protein ACI8W7_003511, partial [Gammaproteobacteria bacterium]